MTIQLIECLKAKASGSVFKSIIASDIENSLLCIAESSIITRFCESVRPFLQKIKENIIEISNLTKQRDELLPLLMNGQVSVNSDLAVLYIIYGLKYQNYEREHHSGDSCENAA